MQIQRIAVFCSIFFLLYKCVGFSIHFYCVYLPADNILEVAQLVLIRLSVQMLRDRCSTLPWHRWVCGYSSFIRVYCKTQQFLLCIYAGQVWEGCLRCILNVGGEKTGLAYTVCRLI